MHSVFKERRRKLLQNLCVEESILIFITVPQSFQVRWKGGAWGSAPVKVFEKERCLLSHKQEHNV
jgi:hypothetical protein